MPAVHRSRSLPQADLATSLAPLPASAEQNRVLRADLQCFLCAHTFGALEAAAMATMPAVARFCPADGSPSRLLAWRGLRCPRCRSNSLCLDELEIVMRRVERVVDWSIKQSRRGRPPRWLVALRAQQDAA
ncbi:MAG TPA: hypothetical protein VIY30_17040 [Burkholderiaceae bacterium]